MKLLAVLSLPLALAPTAAPAEAPEPPWPVATIVRVPKPWYAPRALVAAKMRDTRAAYARLNGLVFKAYSFERTSGDFGGLYLWQDDAAARAWFTPAWFERVRAERGVEGQVRYFTVPRVLDTLPGGPPAEADGTAVATLVELPMPAGATHAQLLAGLAEMLPEHRAAPGLLRTHLVWSDAARTFGTIDLWRDEAAARAWFGAAWQARMQQRHGQPARIEWFDTPILLPVAALPAPAPQADAAMIAPR